MFVFGVYRHLGLVFCCFVEGDGVAVVGSYSSRTGLRAHLGLLPFAAVQGVRTGAPPSPQVGPGSLSPLYVGLVR